MKTLPASLVERVAWMQDNPLFTGLSASVLQLLSNAASMYSFETEENLFLQHENVKGFYLIVDGKVKISRYSVDGREQVLHILSKNDTCGEAAVFKGQSYPATAEALTPVKTIFLPAREFLELGIKNPDILLNMLANLSIRLRHFVNLVDDVSLKEVSARVAAYIVNLIPNDKCHTVQLDTTKTMMASRIGTIAETLSRTFTKMQKNNIIKMQGKEIRILNRDALHALAQGEKL
jgi:CRP/FNR family transcriptional regulator, dissimilatory nitrate respiration regulator